ncbi:autotransporter-associated beta strand repeat-containing protein [Burkholderia multivorans]|uniref:autotransporter-associated beta strand repeat-containing protein n=1 Tax=Burkholderia multivorans TaxID=87883 RepID=UPI001C61659B|nr:autotransporter-associated beta strand repeat-containing protein [Burkholderia multivorans]
MNRIYRIVFNRSLGLWQVVSETARARGKAGRSAALAGAALALALAAGPALADGGGGSNHRNTGLGGAGGVDNPLGPGGAGGDAVPGSTQGGGGGGAGITGGAGGQGDSASGAGNGGAGGAHGAVLAGTLSDITAATAGSGGGQGGFGSGGDGGGGGAGGYGVVMDAGGDLGTLAGSLTVRGGDGGAGGDSPNRYGGDGGSGGVGLYLAQPDASVTIAGTVSGGDGGKGGGGLGAGASGSGGNGGAGLVFAQSGGTAVITGTVQGGNGGAAYAGSPNGVGGVGITGADLTVINSGTISGGLSGDGATRADAIDFTGGVNTLELRAGSTITGNVLAYSSADTLRLGGDADAVFDVSQIGTQYSGFGVFEKTGASTWALSGATTQATPWTVQAGTLRAIASNVLGDDSAITVNAGATLDLNDNSQSIGSLAGAGGVTLGGNGATLLTTGGDDTSTTFSGVISGAGGLVKTGTGTFTLSGANTYAGSTTISGGTLAVSADANLGAASGGLTLAGGTLENTAAFTSARDITLGSGTAGIFQTDADLTLSGTIGGAGGLAKLGAGTLTLTGTADYGSNSVSPVTSTSVDGGALVVDGGNLTNAESIDVGINNDAALVVKNGGVIDTLGITGGSGDLSSSGRIIVTGPGSTLTTTSSILDVNLLNGSLTLEDGGTLMTGSGTGVRLWNGSTINFGSPDLANPTTAGSYSGAPITGQVASGGGIVNFNQTDSLTLAAPLTGALAVNQRGTGTTLLTGANTYTGGTTITAGTLAFAAADNLGSGAVTLDGGTLQWAAGNTADVSDRLNPLGESGATFDTHGNDVAFASGLSGAGGLFKQGAGTLTLTGTNGYTGGTVIDAGTLQIGDGGASGSIVGNVVDNGVLAFDRSDALTVDGTVSGTGVLVQAGSGTTILTADNSYTGGTTISAGTLQLGSGGASGSIVGNVVDNGALVFDRAGTLTMNGVVSGTGSVTQSGPAGSATVLTGANSYAGATTVSGGTLYIDGDQSAATGATSVAGGAALGGIGTIGGSVAIAGGGTLTPGDTGPAPGTLTIKGDLSLDNGASLAYSFGQANVVGGPLNDLTDVQGNLTLGGTLNVATSTGGSLDPGIYRVINYAGSLTNNGLALGTVPAGSFFVQTSVVNQVNLVNTAGLTLNYWDGAAGGKNDGAIAGGDGVWQNSAGNDNWTTVDGTLNAPWASNAYAVFSAAPGTVTVDGSLGAVGASGMQFASDGYVVQGDAITLVGSTAAPGVSVIRVGDGASDGAAYTATINSVLAGATTLEKTDFGTLVLNGANTYTGGTQIDGGVVQVASDANLGAAAGGLGLDGGTLRTTADMTTARAVTLGTNGGAFDTLSGTTLAIGSAIAGAGAMTKAGDGTLVLTGANTYTGTTTIAAGTLALSGAGSVAASSGVLDNGVLDISGTTSGASIKNLAGSGTVNLGSQSLTLTNASGIFSGTFTGTGQFVKQGSGLLTLNGDSSAFSGTTTVSGGTLEVGDINTPSAVLGSNVTVDDAGTLRGHGSILGDVANNGIVAPGGSIGTLSVKGNYKQTGNAALNIEVSPTAASQLKVGGSASLAGTLNVTYAPGTYSPRSYTLVSASQGITGAFDTVNHIGTANLGGLSPGLGYTDNTVDLSLTGSNASVVVAPTQTSIYTAMGTAAVLGAQATNAALLDRAGSAGGAAADANASGSAAWATLTGNVTEVAGRAAAPGFQAQRYGFLAGRDFSSDPDAAGIAFGYDHAALSEHDTGDTGTLDTVRAMLYGRRDAGPVTLGATAGVGLVSLSQKRSFGQFGMAEDDHAGQEFTLGAQASLPLALGANTTLTPKLGLRYAWFHADGFGEHGAGGQNLKVGSDTVNSLQPYVGVALDQAFGDAAHPANAQLRVGYARELLDASRSLGVMSQDGTQFTAPGTSLPRGYLTAGVGVTLHAAKNLDVTFSYDTLFNTGGARAQQGSLNVSYRF